MARARCLLPILVSFALIASATTHAAAQSSGYAVNRFEPSVRGSDWYASESLDLRGRARPFAGIVGDWAYRPQGTPITDDVFLHVGGGLNFLDRYRVAVSLPFALYRNADVGRTVVGDVRASFDAGLLGDYGDPAHVAIGAQVFIPSGSRSAFTSDGTMRFAPRVTFAGDYLAFAYATKIGFAYRPFDGAYDGRELGSEAFFSASGGVKVNDRVIFGPELYGASVVTGHDAFAKRATSLEGLLGMRLVIFDDFRVGNAIGTGFVQGDGSPDFRLLISFDFIPDVCIDKDGDGICEYEDACPLVYGVRTNVRSTNGCPQARPTPEKPTPEPPKEPPAEEKEEKEKEKKETPPPEPTEVPPAEALPPPALPTPPPAPSQ